ncbi:MAG: hypothetical protein M1836_002752 [Candelina mexicana]|nr:MAG: hypothetical protein M1836_002752 [Candelina mexicana]
MDPNRMDQGFDDIDPSLQQQSQYLYNENLGPNYHSFFNHPQQESSFVPGSHWNHQVPYDSPDRNAYQPLESTYSGDTFLSGPTAGGRIDGFARSSAENPALYNLNHHFHELPQYHASAYGTPLGYNGFVPDNTGRLDRNGGYDTLQQTFAPSNTVAPSALQTKATFPSNGLEPDTGSQSSQPRSRNQSSTPRPSTQDRDSTTSRSLSGQPTGPTVLPISVASGRFFIKDLNQLAQSTDSTLLGNNFVAVGRQSVDLRTTKTTIPKYIRRNSRNEMQALMSKSNEYTSLGRSRLPPTKRLKVTAKQSRHRSGSESSSESDAEDDSEYSSSDEEGLEIEEPSPLPATKPADPIGIVRYDTIKALYLPNRQATNDQIKKGLIDYGGILKPIRESIKSATDALKLAEDEKNTALIPNIKSQLVEARGKLEAAFETAVGTGHKDILEHLSQNPPIISILSSSLLDRIKEVDYEGTLTTNIVELISRITIDSELLEKSKLDKLLTRLSKKGNEKIKQLSQAILANAAATTKRRADANKVAKEDVFKKQDIRKEAPSGNRVPVPAAGIKRSRESETSTQPLKKTTNTQGTAATASTGLNKSTGMFTKRTTAGGGSKSAQNASTPPTPAKPRTHQVVARPTSFFSSLQSASKKPGTSNAAVAAIQKSAMSSAAPEPTTSATSPPVTEVPPKPAFSFSETMANLMKPKAPEMLAKPEASRQPETESEKRKRLRREKLGDMGIKGVTFKPDETLVQIRVLSPGPEEEFDRMDLDEPMVRDVDDVGGEGRMFKKHLDVDLMDEDEDGEGPEITIRPFRSPSLVDFRAMRQKAVDINYAAFGGIQEVESEERRVQEQREARIPMEYYIDTSSIPPSPKEPPNSYFEEPSMTVPFGEPQELTVTRDAEIRVKQNLPPRQPVQVAPSYDVSAILASLKQSSEPQQQPPPQMSEAQTQHFQAPQAQAQTSDLEKIFAQFSNKAPQSAPQPQVQQQAPLPGALPAGVDLRALLAGLPQQSQGQAQPQIPVPDPTQAAQLQTLLARLGQPSLSQLAGFGYPAAQSNPYGSADQDRNGNPSGGNWAGRDGQADYHNRNYGNGDTRGNNKQNNKVIKGPGNWKAKTLPCKYWASGKCKKGDRCTFLHDE